MTKVKYIYNLKTLRFERAPFQWSVWIARILGFITISFLFFAIFFYLQNRFFETEKEKMLRAQNNALKQHQSKIENEIGKAQVQLASLNSKDQIIYKRIFFEDKPSTSVTEKTSTDLLSIELSSFENIISQLKNKANTIHQAAIVSNVRFKKLFWPKKKDVKELQFYPTQIPVKNFEPNRIACGYGEHINPFNKLLYRHKGIDITAEKGSDVIASGNGHVVSAVIQSTPHGLGNYVEIEHDKGYRSRYAHLDAVNVVSGQKIKQGQVIGTIGTTGGAIAPHLHYEISKNNSLVDPIYFFAEQLNEHEWLGLVESNKKVKQALD